MPREPVAIAVALADSSTCCGLRAIDEADRPKDPYALRRAAFGVIRILIENGKRIYLADVFWHHLHRIVQQIAGTSLSDVGVMDIYGAEKFRVDAERVRNNIKDPRVQNVLPHYEKVFSEKPTLLAFIADR